MKKPTNANLFAALRAAFPADLDGIAVETDNGLFYSWRDLERASAMIANLLDALKLEKGARIAVQVEKSVEAMLLYLATLRAGYVFLPLNTAYQSAEIEYFIGNAEPAVVVCTSRNASWVGPIANAAGTRNVFTLDDDRTGTLLEVAAQCSDKHTPAKKSPDDLAAILYTSGTTGRSKGAMLTHGNLLSNAEVLKDCWGWTPGDVLIHTLPIFHVHGLFVALHGALLNGSKMLWFAKFDPKRIVAKLPEATVFMGVPTLYVRLLAEPGLTREGRAQHAPVRRGLGTAAHRDLRRMEGAHRPHHPRALRHERDGHAHLQPLQARAGRAPWRHRRLRAAGRATARARREGQRLHHRRDRRHRGRRPQRVRRLLAHAREDGRRVHRRRLLQDRRRR
jgi:acyl-CoA synthetase (AMP-forming)/AMP-acid ligase II